MGIERILIAEENAQGRDFLQRVLMEKGYEIEVFSEGGDALAAFMKSDFDLVMVSENLSDISGRLFLERVKDLDRAVQVLHPFQEQVVLLTDHGCTLDWSAAPGGGDADCIFRPYDLDRIQMLLDRLAHSRRLQRENDYLRSQFRTDEGPDILVGESMAICQVVDRARELGADRSPVILSGESGTGKETLARAIHFNGDRAAGPFIKVECSSLPENLLESEFFGHERGAFPDAHRKREGRFELAHGGTLVLEGIGEIPVSLQAKLLRFMEEGRFHRMGGRRILEVDVRVIGLTTRDLAREAEAGSFRRDLFNQFSGGCLTLPRLRQRSEDVPLLVSHFITRLRQVNNSHVRGVSPEAMELLSHYRWPGNVRELKNLVQRLVVLDLAEEITPDHLPPEITGGQISRGDPFAALVGMSIHEVEREMILKTLEETGNNKTAAAKILGLTARTLHNKLKLYREQGIISKDAYRPIRKRVETRVVQECAVHPVS